MCLVDTCGCHTGRYRHKIFPSLRKAVLGSSTLSNALQGREREQGKRRVNPGRKRKEEKKKDSLTRGKSLSSQIFTSLSFLEALLEIGISGL